jgi:hypothetical protein
MMQEMLNAEPCLGGASVKNHVENLREQFRDGEYSKSELNKLISYINERYGKKYKA